jgi:hypothetical protein
MSEFFSRWFCNFNKSYSLAIEEDGRVAYAYLMYEEDIIGDIWLYNQISTPIKVNWKNVDDMPFLNPEEYIKVNIPPVVNEDEIRLQWVPNNNDNSIKEVDIYIRQKLIAKLSSGSTPGWSTVVIKDGPLAKVL